MRERKKMPRNKSFIFLSITLSLLLLHFWINATSVNFEELMIDRSNGIKAFCELYKKTLNKIERVS